MYVILCGNPVDGIQVHGLFTSSDDANGWADTALKNETWWVADLIQETMPCFYLVAEHHEMDEKPDLVGPFDEEEEAVAYAETKSVDTEIYYCERIK